MVKENKLATKNNRVVSDRNSNLELLRIFSMFLIVMHHCASHAISNSWGIVGMPFCLNQVLVILSGLWGQVGVSLFVIASSWFLSQGDGIHIKKVIKLVLQTWTICVVITMITLFMNKEAVTLSILFRELITPIYSQYWFITTYIVFYMSVPILQKVVRTISIQSLGKIVLVFAFFIPIYQLLFTNVGATLADFIWLFFATAYLRKKADNFINRHSYSLMIGFTVFICLCALAVDIMGVTGKLSVIEQINMINRIINRNIIIYLLSFAIFFSFQKIKMKNNRVINRMASATFGVYLIHENILLRGEGSASSWLWDKVFRLDQAFAEGGIYFVVNYLVAILLVYIVCSLLELIRKYIFDDMIIDKWSYLNLLCNRFDKWYKMY